jgi:pimeloyl-ACP methyl ester carboxylesterase
VVLVPAAGLDASCFSDFALRLAQDGFRAIRVNPRRVATSAAPVHRTTLHTLAADVAAVIETAAGGPAHVVGHGFSNQIVRLLAVDRPDLIRSLILLSGTGRIERTDDVLRALRSWFHPDSTEADVLAAVGYLVADPSSAPRIVKAMTHSPAVAAAQLAADRATPRDDIANATTTAPVLVVQGLEDRVAPPAHGRALRDQLGANVHLADIPKAGHFVFLEQPEAASAAVLSFLRDHT